MCDYSLQTIASRPAVVGDKLTTSAFEGTFSKGFAAIGEAETAVCVLPGTELAFDRPIESYKLFSALDFIETYRGNNIRTSVHSVARFCQINKDNPNTHHDALELPDGDIVRLHDLILGQSATVLQLPAQPKTDAEAAEQKRIAISA
jgi:hypothetical protein